MINFRFHFPSQGFISGMNITSFNINIYGCPIYQVTKRRVMLTWVEGKIWHEGTIVYWYAFKPNVKYQMTICPCRFHKKIQRNECFIDVRDINNKPSQVLLILVKNIQLIDSWWCIINLIQYQINNLSNKIVYLYF